MVRRTRSNGRFAKKKNTNSSNDNKNNALLRPPDAHCHPLRNVVLIQIVLTFLPHDNDTKILIQLAGVNSVFLDTISNYATAIFHCWRESLSARSFDALWFKVCAKPLGAHFNFIRQFLAAGASPNVAGVLKTTSSRGNSSSTYWATSRTSALLVAAHRGDAKVIEALVAGGGANLDVNVADNNGETALAVCLRTVGDRADCIKALAAAPGIDVNTVDKSGLPLLVVAASRNHVPYVEALAAAPNVNLEVTNSEGRTALLVAVEKGYAPVVAALAKAGANVNAALSEGRSALVVAMENDDIAVISALAKAGVNVNATYVFDARQYPLLFLAISMGKLGVVSALLAAGADPNCRAPPPSDDGSGGDGDDESGNEEWDEEEGEEENDDLGEEQHGDAEEDDEEQDEDAEEDGAESDEQGDDELSNNNVSNGSSDNLDEGDDGAVGDDSESRVESEHCSSSSITVLMLAAARGLLQHCRALLSAGADVHARDGDGNTALHFSAHRGYLEITKLLLAGGSDPNARDNDARTPLLIAVIMRRRDCVKVLLTAGAVATDVRCSLGWSPITAAADNGDVECLLALLAATNCCADGAEDKVAPIGCAAYNGHVDCVRALVRAGANIEAEYKHGATPIIAAATKGHAECVAVLVQAGANVSAADSRGMTALFRAAQHGRVACVRALVPLMSVSSINAATNDHVTPLEAALEAERKHSAECARVLLAAGATIDPRSKKGWTTLHAAAALGCVERLAELLQEPGVDASLMVEELVGTPLHRAAHAGDAVCVGLLLRAGAAVNAVSDGQTPLHVAAEMGHVACVQALVRVNSDIEARTEQGGTPLMRAAAAGHRECVEVLAAVGANLEAVDNDGCTALMWAACIGETDVAIELLRRGASKLVKCHENKTALDYAREYKNDTIVKVLA